MKSDDFVVCYCQKRTYKPSHNFYVKSYENICINYNYRKRLIDILLLHHCSGGCGIGMTVYQTMTNKSFKSNPHAAAKEVWEKSG